MVTKSLKVGCPTYSVGKQLFILNELKMSNLILRQAILDIDHELGKKVLGEECVKPGYASHWTLEDTCRSIEILLFNRSPKTRSNIPMVIQLP